MQLFIKVFLFKILSENKKYISIYLNYIPNIKEQEVFAQFSLQQETNNTHSSVLCSWRFV